MTVPPNHPFRRHSDNARRVAGGLTQAERVHKAAIGGGQSVAIDFAARVHHLTVGMLGEALLRKTIADPAGFNDRERKLLFQERSQIDRWKRAVDLGFRRQYAIPVHLEVDDASAGPVAAARHATLLELLDHELAEIIEDRNNLAHGQWAWILNNSGTAFTRPAPSPMNYRQIETRGKLVVKIAELIRDLVISEPTFDRDFATGYAAVQHLRTRLAGTDYPNLVRQLRARRR